MSTLTVEEYMRMVELYSLPVWDCDSFDRFMEYNPDIEKVAMITSVNELKNVKGLRTKHGVLKVRWNAIVPKGSHYIMAEPKMPDFRELYAAEFEYDIPKKISFSTSMMGEWLIRGSFPTN